MTSSGLHCAKRYFRLSVNINTEINFKRKFFYGQSMAQLLSSNNERGPKKKEDNYIYFLRACLFIGKKKCPLSFFFCVSHKFIKKRERGKIPSARTIQNKF